ncbi:MAG: hypothetical protein K0R72_294 [Clostridia bacterium]|jgi:type II secretory pathway pseudopilin PulG|nr:hypothetical protein [Clostridia bacterium]
MKKGISLIMLVVIMVVIILSVVIFLNIFRSNSTDTSKDSTFKSNVQEYSEQLTMAISNEYLKNKNFNLNTFNACTWDGKQNCKGTIKQYIKNMSIEDGDEFEIQKGKLVYVGSDTKNEQWLLERGIEKGELEKYDE